MNSWPLNRVVRHLFAPPCSADDRLVLQGDGGERGRHGEYEMEIRDWQEFGAAVGQPLGAREPLAFGAVPVAAGIVGDTHLAAVLALFDMPA